MGSRLMGNIEVSGSTDMELRYKVRNGPGEEEDFVNHCVAIGILVNSCLVKMAGYWFYPIPP